MQRPHVWMLIPLTTLLGAALGCAGGETPTAQAPEPAAVQPAPAAVQPAAAEQPSPVGQAAPADPSPGKGSKAQGQTNANAASEKDKPVADDAFKLDRPPRELITTEDTTFEVNFTASAIGEQTEQQCRAQAGDDMQALSACKRDARDKFPVTVQRFAEKHGSWWWITYERRGKQLVTLHRIPIDFGEETSNSVTILPKGKDQGLSPLSPLPRKVLINVPNSYSIQIEDPQYGTLSYSAKIGLIPSSQ